MSNGQNLGNYESTLATSVEGELFTLPGCRYSGASSKLEPSFILIISILLLIF